MALLSIETWFAVCPAPVLGQRSLGQGFENDEVACPAAALGAGATDVGVGACHMLPEEGIGVLDSSGARGGTVEAPMKAGSTAACPRPAPGSGALIVSDTSKVRPVQSHSFVLAAAAPPCDLSMGW